jgi:hypothetical protein
MGSVRGGEGNLPVYSEFKLPFLARREARTQHSTL